MTKLFAKIALIIFIYYLIFYFYQGVKNPIPALGDSWDYHIPISVSILNGTFVNPTFVPRPQVYYPGSSEAINSIFILLRIPLTLSNLFAVVVLAVVLFKLARTFKLDFYYSLFFSLTFVTLNVIVRWFNAVSIDVWIAVFFSLALILLEKPQKSLKYFLSLGIVTGFLIGSKYTAVLLFGLLVLTYIKNLNKTLTLKSLLIFLIPFSIFGLFWYIRNYLLLGNPIYPLCVLSLPCGNVFDSKTVLSITLSHPKEMFDAFFSEYKFFMFTPVIIIWFMQTKLKRQIKLPYGIKTLSVLGFLTLCIYLLLPTDNYLDIMISSLRYSYPAFIPLLLSLFIIAKHTKKTEVLGLISIASSLVVLSMEYHPKLILISLPLAVTVFKLIEAKVKLSHSIPSSPSPIK